MDKIIELPPSNEIQPCTTAVDIVSKEESTLQHHTPNSNDDGGTASLINACDSAVSNGEGIKVHSENISGKSVSHHSSNSARIHGIEALLTAPPPDADYEVTKINQMGRHQPRM